ncbi:MAG: hypothetical protein WC505_01710 [Patescibacteria group bacterium]
MTRVVRFLDWIEKLPQGTHVGQEIRARAPDLDCLPLFIKQPVLTLYARICIDGLDQPILGLIVSMTVDVENSRFSIEISRNPLQRKLECVLESYPLEKLRGFRQMTREAMIELLGMQPSQPKKRNLNVPAGRTLCALHTATVEPAPRIQP